MTIPVITITLIKNLVNDNSVKNNNHNNVGCDNNNNNNDDGTVRIKSLTAMAIIKTSIKAAVVARYTF